ncbi:hypothetical protein [Yeosuana sp.]|uniref:hypothetical protein n=1 Tax=Yeosuana sp. TaxID=2529388 RepID=UPI004049A912
MSNFKSIFLFFLAFCFLGIKAQNKVSIPSIDSLELLVEMNNPSLSLKIINNSLTKNLTQEQISTLESYKLKPLISIELYDKAFLLSNELLSRKGLSIDLRIDVLLSRPLLFEMKSDFNRS